MLNATRFAAALALSAVSAAVMSAQAPPAPTPPSAPAPASTQPSKPPSVEEPIPVRVDLALSRWLAEKRLSNLPFTLMVAVTSSGNRASLRLGSQVPIPQGSGPTSPITYNNIGTNIDAIVFSAGSGRFRLELNLSDSSVAEGQASAAAGTAAAMPVIKSNSLNTTLLLRDGQPVELVVASDKVSGETIKAEVRVTTVK